MSDHLKGCEVDAVALSGRCHCGCVSYVVNGKPIAVGHCYCRSCQRLSGAGHSTGAMFPKTSFDITGTPSEYSFQTPTGFVDTRFFCSACGSNMFGTNSAAPNFMSLCLGTLDDASAVSPMIGIYSKEKPSWDHLDEGIKNLEGSAAGHVNLTR